MNLKSFNRDNSQMHRPSEPTLRISGKAGLITFNKGACELADIKEGDLIEFYQDEESPRDWYFAKSKNGFPVRSGGKESLSMSLNCVKVARSILKTAKTETACSLAVSNMAMESNGQTYWLIITAKPLNTR